MPQLVDPRTGDVYDVADEDAAGETEKHGLVSPDAFKAQEEGPVMAAARVGTQATLALPQMAGAALEKSLGIGEYDPNVSPAAKAYYDKQRAASTEFANQAALAKEAHPIAGFAGEALPMGIMGALGGGVGAGLAGGGLAGTAAGLGVESALTGVSQEAVNAVSANAGKGRDFSSKAALMNGVVNMALGGLLLGGGHLLSGAAGRAAGEAAEAGAVPSGVRPTEGGPGARNWLSEMDPGEVPEAVQGGRNRAPRTAESAGAAASNFDDLDVAKAIEEIADGKVKPGPIAEAAPAIREQLSVEAARDANVLHDFLYDEAGLGVKHEDFAKGAAEWTPEHIEAQGKWVDDMGNHALKVADDLAETGHAGGLGEAGKAEILKGLERVQGAAGPAERNVAIDNWKRGVDGYISRLGQAGNRAVDQETRQALMNKARGLSDKLRDGLVNEDLFGQNARLQAAHNEPIAEMIGAWKRIEQRLYETTGKTWGETGVGANEMRADPDRFRKIFEDPHLGGKLFQEDLGHFLDNAETLARNRETHGISQLDQLPDVIERFQKLRDDMNTAQVLHAATEKAATESGHLPGGPGVTARGAAAAYAGIHVAEAVGRAIHLPVGQMARSAYGPAGRFFSKVLGGAVPELAEAGTATRALLDRYAGRVKGSELLGDALHRSRVPESLKNFLEAAHAPAARPGVPPPVAPGGQGTGGAPQAPPGSPANDVRGKVAGAAALAGGGALLASGQASATMLPEDQQARDQLDQQLALLPPEERDGQIRTAESLARIQQRTEQRVQGAVKDLFALARDPKAQPRYRSPKARQLDQRSQELDVPKHLARFMGKHDDPVDAWREKAALLDQIVADPAKLARHMAENLGDLPTQQPEIFASMVGQTMAAVEYLSAKKPVVSGRTALDPTGYPPTFEEISEWAGHWVGTAHPLDSLDDLASNELVPEQIEAVQTLWPEGYQMFQTAAMGEIHSLSSKPGVISRQALEQIDSALDLDGAGEATLSSGFADLLKKADAAEQQKLQAEAAQPKPPMQSQGPSRIASSALGSLHPQ